MRHAFEKEGSETIRKTGLRREVYASACENALKSFLQRQIKTIGNSVEDCYECIFFSMYWWRSSARIKGSAKYMTKCWTYGLAVNLEEELAAIFRKTLIKEVPGFHAGANRPHKLAVKAKFDRFIRGSIDPDFAYRHSRKNVRKDNLQYFSLL